MLSPGIRTGWTCCSKELVPYLVRAKQASDLHTNNLVQRMIYTYLTDNNVDIHLEGIRDAYKVQKDIMRDMIVKHFPENTRVTNPEGGMFIWATLNEEYDTDNLINQAINQKIVFVPGSSFYIHDEGRQSMRLNFSNSGPEKIRHGIEKLGKVISHYYEIVKMQKYCK